MITLKLVRPKAKKQHKCNYCNGTIEVGEVYSRSTHVYDGDLYEWKSHDKCQFLASELRMFEDVDEGVTMDYFMESVNEAYRTLFTFETQASFSKRLEAVYKKLKSKV